MFFSKVKLLFLVQPMKLARSDTLNLSGTASMSSGGAKMAKVAVSAFRMQMLITGYSILVVCLELTLVAILKVRTRLAINDQLTRIDFKLFTVSL